MQTVVTKRQLIEHLKPASITTVLGDDKWDMAICRGASLIATHVRLDRVPGGYVVTHGKYRELRRLEIPA